MDEFAPSSELEALNFDNRFFRELPSDPEPTNTRRAVKQACYSPVTPIKFSAPQCVAFSKEAAALIDLSSETCQSEAFAQVFVGNQLLPQMTPLAMCYGGHQFGQWAGQLGDGRAIILGEVINRQNKRWVLQLKGAGPTPYARSADGLAVLRSSVREFLCSEAMFHLGVPTTRALSLILTGDQVLRDMFYDGHPQLEPGAVVCRLAPSFTRFGNFEILTAREEITVLKQLTDYTIRTDFPHLGTPTQDVYLEWFKEVLERTADMIVHWMRVGFVHGVMNTDNMSILGLTIDYGPYGWLEDFDPDWTPNTTDASTRRYCFARQPHIAYWNLAQLANAIYPLIGAATPLREILESYVPYYQNRWQEMMAQKLGFRAYEASTDEVLLHELFTLLPQIETDMTLFFRTLSSLESDTTDINQIPDDHLLAPLMSAYYQPEQLKGSLLSRTAGWLRRYLKRLEQDRRPDPIRKRQMDAVNPKYVLRNYLAQLAIDKAEAGDFFLVKEQLDVLRHPYDEQPGKEAFAAKRPDWARHRAGCSMLSCSS